MYLDLGLTWDARRAAGMAELALRFGYAGVAHGVTLTGQQVLDLASHQCPVKPCKLSAPAEACGPLRESLAAGLGLAGPGAAGPLLQLRRLTLAVSTSAQLAAAGRVAQLQPSYHVVAVRPTNEDTMQLACQQGDFDIISLPQEEKLSFPLRGKDVGAFISRGGFFEIELGPALRDGGRRRALLQNAAILLHATRGRNVFLSSGAGDAMEMRSPQDIANFATVIGLRGAMALRSIADVPYRVLQRAALRKGHTQVVAAPSAAPSDPAGDVEMEDARRARARPKARRA